MWFFLRTSEKERKLYSEASVKCCALEDELSRMKHEYDTWKIQLTPMNESKEELERELMSTTAKKDVAESQLKDLNAETKSLLAKIDSLDVDIENERKLSREFSSKCKVLENELSRMKHDADIWESRVTSANDSNDAVNQELQMIYANKDKAESQLKVMLAKVGSLEHELEKERAMSAEFATKCRKLEDELSKIKSEARLQLIPITKEEMDEQQVSLLCFG